jgi:hypothetical protein
MGRFRESQLKRFNKTSNSNLTSFSNFPTAESIYPARIKYHTGSFLAARTNVLMARRIIFQTDTFQVLPGMASRTTNTVRLQPSALAAARYRGLKTSHVNVLELGF